MPSSMADALIPILDLPLTAWVTLDFSAQSSYLEDDLLLPFHF